MHKRGEQVTVQFSASTAATPSTMILYTADGLVRPLAAWEQLLIFNLSGYAASTAGEVTVYTFKSGASTVAPGEAIDSFSQAGYLASFPEGYPCALGVLPHVIAKGAGQIDITGTGGIVARTQPGRPNWRESLTSGITIQP